MKSLGLPHFRRVDDLQASVEFLDLLGLGVPDPEREKAYSEIRHRWRSASPFPPVHHGGSEAVHRKRSIGRHGEGPGSIPTRDPLPRSQEGPVRGEHGVEIRRSGDPSSEAAAPSPGLSNRLDVIEAEPPRPIGSFRGGVHRDHLEEHPFPEP